jgi:hypothetical protein
VRALGERYSVSSSWRTFSLSSGMTKYGHNLPRPGLSVEVRVMEGSGHSGLDCYEAQLGTEVPLPVNGVQVTERGTNPMPVPGPADLPEVP